MATAVEPRRRDLSLVPSLKRRKEDPIESSELEPEINELSIEASFNDLLMVCNKVKVNEYHICNPFTKECFSLPRLPDTDLIRRRNRINLMAGCICDAYSCDKHYGCFTNAHYRCKVLLIHSPTIESNTSDQSQLQMEIFSSETGEWCNSIASVSLKLNPFGVRSMLAGVVASNGKLYWVDVEKETGKIQGFVVFDPFKEEEQCRYINPPLDLLLNQYVSFGVFRGRLRIFQHLWRPKHSFFVWELEDEDAGTWCMKHEVEHKVHFKHEVYLSGLVTNDFLAFHPYNGEIVFLRSGNYIVLCNMWTMELKIEGKVRNMPSILFPDFAKFVLLLLQPSWPTTIPPLPLKFGG